MTVFALLGSTALWLLYAWLLSGIVASYLSGRKGYGEKVGLGSGLLLSVIGLAIWLIIPAKSTSIASQRKARKEQEQGQSPTAGA